MDAAVTPVTATLLDGSLDYECDRIVRYDWTEYDLAVDWLPGVAGWEITAPLDVTTLAEAKAEAELARRMFVGRGMASAVHLRLVARTCTVVTEYYPHTHEDGDGSMGSESRVIEGRRWEWVPRTGPRNLGRESAAAEEALRDMAMQPSTDPSRRSSEKKSRGRLTSATRSATIYLSPQVDHRRTTR
jgi:hypothetical protein